MRRSTMLCLLVVFCTPLTIVGCDKPAADQPAGEKSPAAEDPPAEDPPAAAAPDTSGAATLIIESPRTAGPTHLSLAANGEVSIAGEVVGALAKDGSLTLAGKPAGALGPQTYTLAGFSQPFALGADGTMNQHDVDYIAWAPDGTMRGKLLEETPGTQGSVSGDPSLRREMTFLLMASTVALGPDLGATKPVPPLSLEHLAAAEATIEGLFAAMAAGDLDGVVSRCQFPLHLGTKVVDEDEFRAQMKSEIESRAKPGAPAPTVEIEQIDDATRLARIVPGTGDGIAGFMVEMQAAGANRVETLQIAVSISDTPKVVGMLDRG